MYKQEFPWSYIDKPAITQYYKNLFKVKTASAILNHPIDSLEQKSRVVSFIETQLKGLSYSYDISKSILEQRISVKYKDKFITPKISFYVLLYIGSTPIKEYASKAIQLVQDKANKHFSEETSRYKICSLDLSNVKAITCSIQDINTRQVIIVPRRKLLSEYTTWDELFAYYNGTRDKLLKDRQASKQKQKLFSVLERKVAMLDISDLSIHYDAFQLSGKYYRLSYKDKQILLGKGIFANYKVTDSAKSTKLLELKDYVLRCIIAQERYNSLRPVLYTDIDYCALVQQKTNGKFKAYNDYYPSKAHKDITTRVVCNKCGSIVTVRKGLCLKDVKCPKCDKAIAKNYSKSAILWLNDIADRFDISDIVHAENGTEHCIWLDSRTRHYVDGYSKKYNLVLEYFGSRWHGNPTMFYMNDNTVNPYDTSVTAYDYLHRTMVTEKKILDLGYNYIRIWDIDFLDEHRYEQWLKDNKVRLCKILNKLI